MLQLPLSKMATKALRYENQLKDIGNDVLMQSISNVKTTGNNLTHALKR